VDGGGNPYAQALVNGNNHGFDPTSRRALICHERDGSPTRRSRGLASVSARA
jgi:hypothetical protein